MVNQEAATVLLETAKHIHKWAKKGDVLTGTETLLSKRAHTNAWRAVSHLIPVLQHAKESDLYWKLLEIAGDTNKSEKERRRLYSIAKQEDIGFMLQKGHLEEMVETALLIDKLDPKGLTDRADDEARRKTREANEAFDAAGKALNKEFAKIPVSPKSRKAMSERAEALVRARAEAIATADNALEAVYLQVGLTPLVPSAKFLKAQRKTQKAAGLVPNKPAERVAFWQTPEYLAARDARTKAVEAEEKKAAALHAADQKAAARKAPVKKPVAKKPIVEAFAKKVA